MCYWDDGDYFEPGEFDEKIEELKNELRESVKKEINDEIEKLRKEMPAMRIELFDERFTSRLALRAMIDGGVPKKRRREDKGLVDRISATIILQGYLDSRDNHLTNK